MKKQLLIFVVSLAVCLPVFSMSSATLQQQTAQEIVEEVMGQQVDKMISEMLLSRFWTRVNLFVDRILGTHTYENSLNKLLKGPEALALKEELKAVFFAKPEVKELVNQANDIKDPQALEDFRQALIENLNLKAAKK